MAPGEIFDFEESSAPQFISAKTDSTGLINSGLRTITRPTVVPVLHDLDISSLPTGTVSKFSLVISPNALDTVNIPVFAYRSGRPGPIVGITCAIHGNEVNGIPVIQRLFADIEGGLKADDATIGSKKIFKVDCGTIIGIPVVNVPGFLTSNRCFDDESKQDLNRLMPGKPDGAAPQQYAHAIFNKVVAKLDCVIDLHTASAGRRNSLYVRADMNHPEISKLARLMKPQILVHIATGGSLRGCAQAKGILALTVEIGSASVFQIPLILATYAGIRRVITSLGMAAEYNPSEEIIDVSVNLGLDKTAVCTRSFWIFSTAGGILKGSGRSSGKSYLNNKINTKVVFKDIAEHVQPGELIAEIQSIFGDAIEKIYAPDYDTVVVGVEGNPVAKGGNRVIHLGVLGEDFAPVAMDGHM